MCTLWFQCQSEYRAIAPLNVHFPKVLPHCDLPDFTVPWGSLFPVVWPESWGFSYPAIPGTSVTVPTFGPRAMKAERGNKEMGVCPSSWGLSSFKWRVRFPSLQLLAPIDSHWGLCGGCGRREQEEKKNWGISPLSLSSVSSLSGSLRLTRELLLEHSVGLWCLLPRFWLPSGQVGETNRYEKPVPRL